MTQRITKLSERIQATLTLGQSIAWIVGLVFFGASSTALAEPDSDRLKQRLLEQAKSLSPDEYSFTRTIRTEQSSGARTEKKVTVERFDPTKPPEARWTLVSVNGGSPSTDDLNQFRKDSSKRRTPGYHRLAKYLETPAKASVDSGGRTVFQFANLPKESVILFDTDVSQNATAEASVSQTADNPFIEQLHLTLKPMRLKLIMKLQQYQSIASYRLGPEGKPLLAEQISDMTGSGMGKEGRAHTVITYSDYRFVSRQP